MAALIVVAALALAAASCSSSADDDSAASNLSQHNSLTLPMLMDELESSFKVPLSNADAIIVGIAHNSNLLSTGTACGTVFDEEASSYRGWTKITPDQEKRTVVVHDDWNRMLCESAEAHGFLCADIYHAFNGPQGSKPSGELLAADYTHPSDEGNARIAQVLVAQGFDPLV